VANSSFNLWHLILSVREGGGVYVGCTGAGLGADKVALSSRESNGPPRKTFTPANPRMPSNPMTYPIQ